mmetsp:Transcript_16769/g.34801  ORF Transcript_16769/g.34801 Transcript_16769/m.34801 type:complete len:206 (-) Transcript_16769:287-904(-)
MGLQTHNHIFFQILQCHINIFSVWIEELNIGIIRGRFAFRQIFFQYVLIDGRIIPRFIDRLPRLYDSRLPVLQLFHAGQHAFPDFSRSPSSELYSVMEGTQQSLDGLAKGTEDHGIFRQYPSKESGIQPHMRFQGGTVIVIGRLDRRHRRDVFEWKIWIFHELQALLHLLGVATMGSEVHGGGAGIVFVAMECGTWGLGEASLRE